MAQLAIVKIGHPVLRERCADISPEIFKDPQFHAFLKDMIETMHQAEGVGLAANQVGQGIRVIVLEGSKNSRYPQAEAFALERYINPRIVSFSKDKIKDWEGCLSVPGYRGLVPRAAEVTFEALTPEGQKVTKTVSGFHARVIQHEVDHIEGLFYLDRMPDLKSWMHLEEFEKKKT